MGNGLVNFGRTAVNGKARGLRYTLFRAGASLVEPFYTAAMTARNTGYDRGWLRSFDLGRPTISVGNVTTGGTGKTPVVRWLAERLRRAGHRPAVLIRGYGAGRDGDSDERLLLDRGLNRGGDLAGIPVIANPARTAGAAAALVAAPRVDRLILDDGFQHRRAKRDFDLVLVNATDPFGGGRVLPRGLLREPMRGLRRADAVVITRASLVPADRVDEIRRQIRRVVPELPIFSADHVLSEAGVDLRGRRVVAVSGIGDPESFERQLVAAGAEVVDRIRYVDHHRYTDRDIEDLRRRAAGIWAVTTEKDWVKLGPLIPAAERTGWIVPGLEIRFSSAGEEEGLLGSICEACSGSHRPVGGHRGIRG